MEYYNNMIGDGTTKTFYFTFPFFGVNDVQVTIDGVAQTTDEYIMTPTLTPNDADTQYTGGSIEFLTAPANGAEIIIYREIDLVRHIDYQPTEKPLSYQLNQEFNQCIGALREIKIKIQNILNLATLPTLVNLLTTVTDIQESLPDFLTADDLTDINTAIATLPNKADIDMDNLSSTGKSTITSLGMPDYANGTQLSVSAGQSVQIEQDCCLYLYASNNGGIQIRQTNANGIILAQLTQNSSIETSCMIYVPAGITIYIKTKTGNSGITKYPLRGQ